MARLYVSNKDESVRMFRSSFLEFFTHVHPVVPHILFIPVLTAMMVLTVESGMDTLHGVVMAVSGLAIWSVTEYVMHRFVFHHHPEKGWLHRVHFIVHGVHHDYPGDSRRLVMPPVLSLPLSAGFYILFRVLLGPLHAPFFFGFILGYLCYDTLHYAVHHFPMSGTIGTFLKKHHLRHHYATPEHNFGVSSPLWDWVFRTFIRRAVLEPEELVQDWTASHSAK